MSLSPRFYWYPEASSTLQTLALPSLSELSEAPETVAADGRGIGGQTTRMFAHSASIVSFRLEKFGSAIDRSVVCQLRALENHLQRGGSVGFSIDHSKTWAAMMTSTGGPYVGVGANGFSVWSASGAVVAGDSVVLDSGPPRCRVEECRIASLTSSLITTESPYPQFDYPTLGLARWRGFWPVLRLPESALGTPLLVNDHEITYSAAWQLRYEVRDVLDLFHGVLGTQYDAIGLRGTLPGIGYSIEEYLQARRNRPGSSRFGFGGGP